MPLQNWRVVKLHFDLSSTYINWRIYTMALTATVNVQGSVVHEFNGGSLASSQAARPLEGL